LLLDEPTNNLDHAGIEHLTAFLVNYKKTVVVISHDAEFLNSFTEGVLYLDVYTKKIEQYTGNYYDVVKDISARIERENRKNALLAKEIQAKKDQANKFAMKGGNLRAVAKRMRDDAAEMEEEKVDVRKEDKTIRAFTIPAQENINGDIVTIESLSVLDFKTHKPKKKEVKVKLRKNQHLQLAGPNGIGKSTLLERLASNEAEGVSIQSGIRIGYYRQDFSTLDFNQTVYESLSAIVKEVEGKLDEERMRATAASFLITGDLMYTKIGVLSEGQKGLVAFARLVLQKPGLLILDEPTNHINFRHLPVIAEALNKFTGAMIVVSHVPDFVEKIRIDEVLDLGK
jgi:ATP-binding cassette subfamily F protein 3